MGGNQNGTGGGTALGGSGGSGGAAPAAGATGQANPATPPEAFVTHSRKMAMGYFKQAFNLEAMGLADVLGEGFDVKTLDTQQKAQLDILNRVYAINSELLDFENSIVGQFGGGSKAFEHLLEGTQEVYTNFYTMQVDTTQKLSTYFKDAEQLSGEYLKIMGSNILEVHALNKEASAEDMARLTLQQRALGFSTNTTQDFLERQFALTGEANDDLLKQTLAYSIAVETSTGISSKLISANIAGMMSNVEIFGNMTVEEMSQAAAAIAEVGLQVNDVAKIVGKFNTFEDAAGSVSKLTQVFGVQLDTMELMTAANESPEALAGMLQESFEMAGVDMTTMDMPAKRMLASALGGLGVDDVEKLLGPAGQGLSQFASKIEGVTAGVTTEDINNSLINAEGNLERVNRLGKTIQEGVNNAALMGQEAMVAGFSTSMNELHDGMIRFGTESAALIGNITQAVPTALDALTGGALTNVGTLISEFGGTVGGFIDAIRDANETVKRFNNSGGTDAEAQAEILDYIASFGGTVSEQISDNMTNSLDAMTNAVKTAGEGSIVVADFAEDFIDTAAEIAAVVDKLDKETEMSEAAIASLRAALTEAIETTPVAQITFQGDMATIVSAVLSDDRFVTQGGS